MKRLVINFVAVAALFFLLPSVHPPSGSLDLTVENVREKSGRLWVGIYCSEDDFLDRKKARLVEVEIDKTGRITFPLDQLEYGKDYALAIFHDVNDNGELDRNFLGLPAEPWAFSGEPRTRLRLPYFGEVKFRFGMRTREQTLRLRKW